MIHFLLSKGVDPQCKDCVGSTAMDILRSAKKKGVQNASVALRWIEKFDKKSFAESGVSWELKDAFWNLVEEVEEEGEAPAKKKGGDDDADDADVPPPPAVAEPVSIPAAGLPPDSEQDKKSTPAAPVAATAATAAADPPTSTLGEAEAAILARMPPLKDIDEGSEEEEEGEMTMAPDREPDPVPLVVTPTVVRPESPSVDRIMYPLVPAPAVVEVPPFDDDDPRLLKSMEQAESLSREKMELLSRVQELEAQVSSLNKRLRRRKDSVEQAEEGESQPKAPSSVSDSAPAGLVDQVPVADADVYEPSEDSLFFGPSTRALRTALREEVDDADDATAAKKFREIQDTFLQCQIQFVPKFVNAAQRALVVGRYDAALKHIERALLVMPDDEDILELQDLVLEKKDVAEKKQ